MLDSFESLIKEDKRKKGIIGELIDMAMATGYLPPYPRDKFIQSGALRMRQLISSVNDLCKGFGRGIFLARTE